VIEDDYSNYKCFEQLEREYLLECQEFEAKRPQIETKVILSSPIYRLTDEEPAQCSPFTREMTDKPHRVRSHLQPTLSTSSKQRINPSKDKVRRQLFK
jgi:hypothetical protein